MLSPIDDEGPRGLARRDCRWVNPRSSLRRASRTRINRPHLVGTTAGLPPLDVVPRRRRSVPIRDPAASCHPAPHDVRLEMTVSGTSRCWSPGPCPRVCPAAGDRLLAIRTPDHEMEWGAFSGSIAEEEYGVGGADLRPRGIRDGRTEAMTVSPSNSGATVSPAFGTWYTPVSRTERISGWR